MHPDREGLAYYISFRYLTPNPTVTAVVTIIAHHEVVPRFDGDRKVIAAPQHVGLHLVVTDPQLFSTEAIAGPAWWQLCHQLLRHLFTIDI